MWVTRRRTREVSIHKSYKLAHRRRPICYASSRAIDSVSKRVAKGDRTCDRNNRSKPAKADDRRTPTHSSLRRKTNAQPAAGASHSGGKVFGNFKEKHWRISWRNRFFAQSHPGADLSIFPADRKAAHSSARERVSAAARVAPQR